MKFQQDIQYLPLSIRLAFVPMALLSIYIIQLQTHIFTVFKNEMYQGWLMTCLYSIVAVIALCLVAWDQIQTPLKFMYSCFFKRIGNHGNDQQSRLESFYQDQAKSMVFI
jgi:betaine lipid synthase